MPCIYELGGKLPDSMEDFHGMLSCPLAHAAPLQPPAAGEPFGLPAARAGCERSPAPF